MIVPLFACVGYAIDCILVVSVRTKLRAAADAAAFSARTNGWWHAGDSQGSN